MLSNHVEFVGSTEVAVFDDVIEPKEIARKVAIMNDARGVDESFMVFNLAALVAKWQQWRELMPRVRPFYAVKCNNDPVILHVLAKLGAGFDCASGAEIENVLKSPRIVEPSDVIFANTIKSRLALKLAREMGIKRMTFDNEEELVKIQQTHDQAGLVLRIEVTDPTALCKFGVKFGCDPVLEAPRLLQIAADRGMSVVGISFHTGSGSRNPNIIVEGLEHVRRLFDIGTAMGHEMTLVDIGGGFPGTDTSEISLPMIAAVVNPALDRLFPATENYEIMAEPGRLFAERVACMVVHVDASVRVSAAVITENEADQDKTGFVYYVNDGTFGCFNVIIHDGYFPKAEPLMECEDAELFVSRIWGPTCDGNDKIEDNKLMRRVAEGEWLYYDNMGAYTTTAASTFNGFPKPRIHPVIDRASLALLTKNR